MGMATVWAVGLLILLSAKGTDVESFQRDSAAKPPKGWHGPHAGVSVQINQNTATKSSVSWDMSHAGQVLGSYTWLAAAVLGSSDDLERSPHRCRCRTSHCRGEQRDLDNASFPLPVFSYPELQRNQRKIHNEGKSQM